MGGCGVDELGFLDVEQEEVVAEEGELARYYPSYAARCAGEDDVLGVVNLHGFQVLVGELGTGKGM